MRKMTNAGILRPQSPRGRGPRRGPKVVATLWLAAAALAVQPVRAADEQAEQAAAAATEETAEKPNAKPKPPRAGDRIDGKRLIGATAIVVEAKSGIPFAARVDTGAQGTSIHVEEWLIDDKPEKVAQKKNIGKRVKFRIHNQQGQDAWLDGLIIDTVLIKNAEKKERRYKVVMTLRVGEYEKECIVNINDRSGMTYPILIGRNFLRGDFLVDVAMDESVAVKPPEKQEAETDNKGEEVIEEDSPDEGEEMEDDGPDVTEEASEEEQEEQDESAVETAEAKVDPAGELTD